MADLSLIIGAANLAVLLIVIIVLMSKKPADTKGLDDRIALSVNNQLMQFQTAMTETIGSTRKEVLESKGAVEQNAKEMYKHLNALGENIAGLKQQNVGAQELAKNLQIMLQQPKLRGGHGEQILEEMLEKLLPDGLWKPQYNIEGAEAVDAAVIFKDTIFPIDAKFPRDDYERYIDAENENQKRAAWSGFESALKTQIKSISSKYIKPEKGTADFALMFIPSEAVYYETVATSNGLGDENKIADYARQHNVIPVSPNTLYAFLGVILAAVDQMTLADNARLLQSKLADINKSFNGFYKHYETIGKSLAKAADSYGVADRHIGRFHDRLEAVVNLDLEDADDE